MIDNMFYFFICIYFVHFCISVRQVALTRVEDSSKLCRVLGFSVCLLLFLNTPFVSSTLLLLHVSLTDG